MPGRRQQAVLECARGVMTAAAAGLFAQHLPYIYQGTELHLGACSGPLPAERAPVSTAAGVWALLPPSCLLKET